jgi:hypothetical protein
MDLVFICSPYAGDIETNTIKAKEYCRWAALCRGVVPFAPHLMNTQFLEEFILEERELGINLGLQILEHCKELWIFGNTMSKGMSLELAHARELGIVVRYFGEDCMERGVES